MNPFDQIIAPLSPDMQAILRQLAAGGGALTARELLGIIARLAAAASAAQRASLWRALIWLANTGRIQLAVLMEAAELMAAGEGAVIVTDGAAAGGVAVGGAGAAVAIASIVAFLMALLLAMIAIAIAYYTISAELDTVAEIAPQGKPCTGTGPTAKPHTMIVRRFGSRTSRNAAIKEAGEHAKRVMTCSGGCGDGSDEDGPQCSPVAIPISVIPRFRFFYTATTITYMVGCACI